MSVIKNIDFEGKDGFSLYVKEWDFPDEGLTLLCGPSGSGKTTFLKILCGLISPPSSSGFAWIFKGKDLASLPPPERRLGVLFQDLRLFPALSARENILFPMKAAGAPASLRQSALQKLSRALGIEDLLSRFPEQLSGGEKQRLALARVLSAFPPAPRALLLDEPFAHLDSEARAQALDLILQTLRQKKIPALLISHHVKLLEKEAAKIHRLPSPRPPSAAPSGKPASGKPGG